MQHEIIGGLTQEFSVLWSLKTSEAVGQQSSPDGQVPATLFKTDMQHMENGVRVGVSDCFDVFNRERTDARVTIRLKLPSQLPSRNVKGVHTHHPHTFPYDPAGQ